MEKAVEVGVRMVRDGNWAFAQYLSAEDAKWALEPCLPEIARKQQRSGMWFRKNAEAYTYPILKALRKADLLPRMIDEGILRYNPYERFEGALDEWGLLVRLNIMGVALGADKSLQSRLISECKSKQNASGAWDGTVAGTALWIEKLLELGLAPGESCLTKGAEWLLSQFQESIERKRPNVSWGIVIGNTFTCQDCSSEFQSAGHILTHHKLAASCFVSIPIIQTALAIRALIRLGYERHEKVKRAMDSLLDIQTKTKDFSEDLGEVPLGYWCAHQCRFKLEQRKKANKALQRRPASGIVKGDHSAAGKEAIPECGR